MHQIYPDQGLVDLLTRMATASLQYHLYTNAATINRDTVLADLTEMAITGYAAVTVAAASFTLSGVASHIGSLLAAPISFNNASGSPADAYGYYVTAAGGTHLLAVAQFDSAPVTKADGESWLVTPIIGDFSELSS